MAITDAAFDREAELQTWAFVNCSTFFGNCVLLPGFKITTPSGKQSIPDGFAFNFDEKKWWVIECELLHHGVWPHIAEQITRFVVAVRNSGTLRQVRDKLFERIMESSRHDQVTTALTTTPHRLLQQLELFIEGVSPSIAIFIDDTNQDLEDFCDALDIPSEIYRVKKFLVNGKSEYYSPDRNVPVATFESEVTIQEGSVVFDVIEQLGGGEVINSRTKCYRLSDGRVIAVKYSRFHERNQTFWYGINPSSLEQLKGLGCTHIVFVMASDGFVVVPIATVDAYLSNTLVTKNADGSVRHFHVYISPPPNVAMTGLGGGADLDVGRLYQVLK